MKRFLPLLLLLLAVLILPAASCAPDQVFVKASEGYADVVLPEYENYIKNDPAFSDTDKEIRLDSSKGWRRLIEEAKEDD